MVNYYDQMVKRLCIFCHSNFNDIKICIGVKASKKRKAAITYFDGF